MGLRIAMVAGETSSDLLAAHLIRALKVVQPDAEFFGIGGPRMEAEGFQSWWPCERLAVHGFVDALKRYRELSGIRRQLRNRLVDAPPDVFIGVDAPDFNLWLEGQMKQGGVPAIHFVSPSIWAWRGGRIKTIAKSVDHMLCMFPFEPGIYHQAGVKATFVGHPLADQFPLEPDRLAARLKLHIAPHRPVIAVLPGSRESEVRNLGRLFVDAALLLAQRRPEARFIVPLATRETRLLFEQALRESQAPPDKIRILFGHSVEAMTAADVVLVASGTASLEAALLKRPMVISYRMGKWQYKLMRRLAYLPWVGLPNILCNESLVPELLQDDATPQALADALDQWLRNPVKRAELAQRFTELHLSLSQNTAEKAAEAIMQTLRELNPKALD